MLKLFTYCILIAVGLTGAFLASLIYLPAFNEWRQAYVSQFVSDSFQREIVVNGHVGISVGTSIRVEVNDITVAPLAGQAEGKLERIDHGGFNLSLWQALIGQAEIVTLNVSGVNLVIAAEEQAAAGAEGAAGFPTRYLNRPLAGDLDVANVTFRYVNEAAGWDEEVTIDKLTSRYANDEKDIAILASGKINGVELSFEGSFENPTKLAPEDPSDFSLKLDFPGSSSQMAGKIDVTKPIAVLDANLQSQSDSLGDLLEVLGLKPVLKGTGSLDTNLSGPLDAVSANSLKASANGETLETISVNGGIGNLNERSGLDLKFEAEWKKPDNAPATSASFVDLSVNGFSGQLAGKQGQLSVEQFFLNTNSASFELRDIGPISVNRLAKDDQGRLGILGIKILNGPADRPTLDLEGNVVDALNFTGINLAGKIDIPTVDALSLEGGANSGVLGYLQGKIEVSDTDGTLGIETLTGRVSGSDLIALQLDLKADELGSGDEIAIKTELDIPDVAKFAEVLGATTEAKGGLSFDGSFIVADGKPGIEGDLVINKSEITGKLAGTSETGVSGAKGSVRSKSLSVADLRNLWDINLIRKDQDYDAIQLNEKAFADFGLQLEIYIDSIAESGKSVGAFKGEVAYRDQVFNLDPFSLSYLGGKVSATTSINVQQEPAGFTTKGTITRLAVGKLLKELRAPQVATGTLSARFDMNGSGISDRQILAYANGKITVSLSGGTIATNLLDLTGMNFVSWFFSKSNETSADLVCAVFPFSLKNGRASTGGIVIETKNVQAVGKGTIDIKANKINLEFQPIPTSNQAAAQPTPFKITGALASPEISLEKGAVPQRMVSEFFTAPLNTFASIFGGNNDQSEKTKNKPCVVRKTATTKKK